MPKVHWAIRYGAFALSTFTLSLFFAGWREINTTGHWTGFVVLALGALLTGSLLLLQGYWVYFEEKNKGSLRRRHNFFEWLHHAIETRFGDSKWVKFIQPVVLICEEGNKK